MSFYYYATYHAHYFQIASQSYQDTFSIVEGEAPPKALKMKEGAAEFELEGSEPRLKKGLGHPLKRAISNYLRKRKSFFLLLIS
jgi:hypothetical protein